jgi:PilZ domain-containing protein
VPLFGIFRKREREVRQHPRIKRPFGVNCSPDGGATFVQALPVDISVGGVGLVTEAEIPHEEFVVALQLESKSILARVTRVSSSKGTVRGRIAWRVGTRFAGIDADCIDVVDRFVKELPIETDSLVSALYALRANPTDVARLLPAEALTKIYAELVRRKRLAPLNPAYEPS